MFKLGKSRSAADKRQRKEPLEASYRAVSVRAGKDACEAARSLSSDRMLSAEAPLLPLADCDRIDRCACSYQHHGDRRDGPRRQADGAPPVAASSHGEERRRALGRRADDDPDLDIEEAAAPEDSNLVSDTYYGYGRGSD